MNRAFAAVVVAAGESRRLGSKKPKPFLMLGGGCTVLEASVRALRKVPACAFLVLVVRPDVSTAAARILAKCGAPGVVAAGGAARADSVWEGIQRVPERFREVLIHDAARPFASPRLIHRVAQAARRFGAAVPAVPVADTLKEIRGRFVARTLNRERIRAVQTPQGFSLKVLRHIERKAGPRRARFTDEASLLEAFGRKVAWVEGERENFKITYPDDLDRARRIFRGGKT